MFFFTSNQREKLSQPYLNVNLKMQIYGTLFCSSVLLKLGSRMTRFKDNYGFGLHTCKSSLHFVLMWEISILFCKKKTIMETQLLLLDLVMAQVSTSCTRKCSLETGCCQGNVAVTCDGCWELQVSDYGAVLKRCPVSLCKSGSYPENPKGGAPGSVKGSFIEPVINHWILGDADATSQGLRYEVGGGGRQEKNAVGNWQL